MTWKQKGKQGIQGPEKGRRGMGIEEEVWAKYNHGILYIIYLYCAYETHHYTHLIYADNSPISFNNLASWTKPAGTESVNNHWAISLAPELLFL